MRVLSAVDVLEVSPGEVGEIPLEVINTGEVIEGVTARVLGLPTEHAWTRPAVLPLFPDATGHLVVRLDLPGTFPAGTHPVTVEINGRTGSVHPAHHDVDVVVEHRPRLVLAASPSVVRARRRATFEVQVRNEGNVPLDVSLRAQDSDRSLQAAISPSTVSVPPGGSARCAVMVRGPRQLFGSDRDRPLRVQATAGEQVETAALTLRQRSTLSRGLLTALVLLAIVAAWALVFLFGIRTVLGTDPLTRTAPPSFFAATAIDGGADGTGADGTVTPVGANGQPAGAVDRDGALGAGVGGVLSGTVTGASDGQGVGRITVDALRQGRDGLVLVGSAATQEDGTYAVAGLFPGSYFLRFTADGYDPLWFPGVPGQGGAELVRASTQTVTEGLDVAITGHPATIHGTVDAGDVTTPVTTTVVASATWAPDDAPLAFTTQAAEDGSYTFTDLPAPGTYELVFTAEGYEPVTTTERVAGGQERYATEVLLGAGTGQISGVVTDGRRPLGGVEVSTTLDGEDVVVGTPTIGKVGRFVIPGLTTPGTYVVTFGKDGFSPRTVVVDLTAGEVRTDLEVVLAGGAGTVTGTVTGPDGAGLGGVSVVVGGGPTAVSGTTLTSGQVGSYTLVGLDPGRYTLTFTLAGHAAQSVAVDLSSGTSPPVDVTLQPSVGSITGRVLSGGAGVAGIAVHATQNGQRVWTATSTSTAGSPAGYYVISGLPPGTYTVSVPQAGRTVATAVVRVTAGSAAAQDLVVPAVS